MSTAAIIRDAAEAVALVNRLIDDIAEERYSEKDATRREALGKAQDNAAAAWRSLRTAVVALNA